MKETNIKDSCNILIFQKSIKMVFAVFMIFTASNCYSENNIQAAMARVVGTLRSQVVMGSSPHEVIDILQRHDIEHSAYHEDTAKIDAIVRDVVKSKLGSTSIQVRFLFENDRLFSYILKKSFSRYSVD
jgi:hypothetical protein